MLGHAFAFHRHELWKLRGDAPRDLQEMFTRFGLQHNQIAADDPSNGSQGHFREHTLTIHNMHILSKSAINDID